MTAPRSFGMESRAHRRDDFPGFAPAEAEDAAGAPDLAQLLDDPGWRLRVADKLDLATPVTVNG